MKLSLGKSSASDEKKVSKAEQDLYFAEAKSWEAKRRQALENTDRKKTVAIIALGTLVAIQQMTIYGMLPLKTTEVKVIRMNESTGVTDIVTEIPDSKLSYGDAMDGHWAKMYVQHREGYSLPMAEYSYKVVGIMSAEEEKQRYISFQQNSNPTSPLNVLGTSGRVTVYIKNVTFLSKETIQGISQKNSQNADLRVALVRYSTQVEKPNEKAPLTHWASYVAFRYNGEPMNKADRDINPAGFQVYSYRKDSEAAPPDTNKQADAAPAMAATPPLSGPTIFPGIAPAPAAPAIPAPAAPLVPAPLVPTINRPEAPAQAN